MSDAQKLAGTPTPAKRGLKLEARRHLIMAEGTTNTFGGPVISSVAAFQTNSIDGDGRYWACGESADEMCARVVHAANAYPKLVAVVKQLHDLYYSDEGSIKNVARDADALLSSLGELK